MERSSLEDVRHDRSGTFYVQVSTSSYSSCKELFPIETPITLSALGAWIARAPSTSLTASKIPIIVRGVEHCWDEGEQLLEELQYSNASMFEGLDSPDIKQHVLFSHRLNRKVQVGHDAH